MAAMSALDLRPLSMGDVADRAFAVYRARWLVLSAIGAVSFGLFFFGWFVAATYAAAFFNEVDASLFILLFARGRLALFTPLISGALIGATAATHLGRPRGIVMSLGGGLGGAPRVCFLGVPRPAG